MYAFALTPPSSLERTYFMNGPKDKKLEEDYVPGSDICALFVIKN